MASNGRTTLKQVADLAGVSASAVSMILNNRDGVSFSADTVRRVMETAEQLGYSRRASRLTAPRVVQGLTGSAIVIICPNITSPYYASLVQSIEQSARARDCDTFIYNTYRSPQNERRILESIAPGSVAGIIFSMKPSVPELAEKVSHTVPMVVICDRDTSVNVDTVEASNFSAGVLIGQHLLELGHTHIAYISTTLDRVNTARTKRLEGLNHVFKEQCPTGNVLVKSRNSTPCDELSSITLEHNVGYDLCRECLGDSRITAFVGINDMVAYGITDALLSAGWRIPEDYSVCGFDNSFPSGFGSVSLTTVEHCIEDKGHNAVDILWSKINSRKQSEQANFITRVEYRQLLITRRSTGVARIADKE